MKRASLNHVYRLVWSERLNAFVAIAEIARARGKRSGRALLLLAALGMAAMPAAHALEAGALPTGGTVVAGSGSIAQQGNTLSVQQGSERLIAQWDTFNVGKDAKVVFDQAGSNSIALNRIADTNPSEILGSLQANGKVFLVNPSGIVFGEGAQVNVGGLVASSLDIQNDDFLAGDYKFTGGAASGAVVNRGTISTTQGGAVALIAPQVTNEGTIKAQQGSALLAAGQGVTLDFAGDGLISYSIDAGTVDALVRNGGLVQVDGGVAVLTAKGVDAVSQAVVNNTGTVRARTLAEREGRILLLSDMQYGTTLNNGTLDASAPEAGNGGFVETSAANVRIGDNTVIDTRAASGKTGEWLLDPDDVVIAASGGTITGATLARLLERSHATVISYAGGDIILNDSVTYTGTASGNNLTFISDRDIQINDRIVSTSSALNVVLDASRDVKFAGTGAIDTKGGRFVVGSGTYPVFAGNGFTMANGSYVDVGTGALDIAVNGTIQLAADALRGTGDSSHPTVTISAGNVEFADNSVNVGARSFMARATSMLGSGNNAVADIRAGTVTLQGTWIGSAGRRLEIAGGGIIGGTDTLNVDNVGGSTYLSSVDDSFRDIYLTNVKTAGTHSLRFWADHIDYTTDGNGILLPTIGADSGADVSSGNRLLSITENGGDIHFANNSVNTGSGTFRAIIGSTPDGSWGQGIFALDPDSGTTEITAGDVDLIADTLHARILGIRIAPGAGAFDSTLRVSTWGGAVKIMETAPHFASTILELHGQGLSAQQIQIELYDRGLIVLLGSPGFAWISNLRLRDHNFSLSAPDRNVHCLGASMGSGSLALDAGTLHLYGDVLTDGGNIALTADNISLLNSLRIDSNADTDDVGASTGAAGNIALTGNISLAYDAGHVLTVDASSSTHRGGSIDFTGNLDNSGGHFLGGAWFDASGNQDDSDGVVTFRSSTIRLLGTFSSTGETRLIGDTNRLTIDTSGEHPGSILFDGRCLALSPDVDYVFKAAGSVPGADGGNVDLRTSSSDVLAARSLAIDTRGTAGGFSGTITLPAIDTSAATDSASFQHYAGGIITLHGDLTAGGGGITLEGDTRLARSVTLRTSRQLATDPGTVRIGGAGVSAIAANLSLSVETGGTSGRTGDVQLSTGTAGGYAIHDLSIDTTLHGPTVESGTIYVNADTTTAGNQTYAGSSFFAAGKLESPGTISITTPNDAVNVLSSPIVADALALRGGTYFFSGFENRVGTLAAQVDSLSYINADALTIGTVGGIHGIDSFRSMYVGTETGDLTLARNVSTSSSSDDAIVLRAGRSQSAGTATGGNILVHEGVSLTTGDGGRATLYTGSVDGSTGLTDLVGWGSGNFRYGSTEIYEAST